MVELIEVAGYFFNWLKEFIQFKIGKTLFLLDATKHHV